MPHTKEEKKKYQLVATCIDSSYEDINAFDESSKQITYNTFRKYVNIRWVQDYLGYSDSPLTLKKDYAVSYAKGYFKGKPCVVMFWSAIHHFFIKE
jgi:hypothetical protein